MVCLDTDVLIAFLRGESAATSFLAKLPQKDMKTTAVNAAELFEGAFLAPNAEKVLPKIEGLLSQMEILPADLVAAHFFGRVVAALSRQGRKPSDFDALIAAVALANNETLVTRDEHLKQIGGLTVKRW
ncbi:MAG: type II toxin-antitoxin system VapC family toxin [Candidatus Micrarchaeota archaeon]|nr:type II toxin-antitoxin system VapC family toxin [Candidatus Micrarchaeota archaeon]